MLAPLNLVAKLQVKPIVETTERKKTTHCLISWKHLKFGSSLNVLHGNSTMLPS